jgi:hypothetical protein
VWFLSRPDDWRPGTWLPVAPPGWTQDSPQARPEKIIVAPQVLTVQGAMPRDADFKQHLCADIDGFSLHAAVRCGAGDRQALEHLCRYITRSALTNERVQTNAAGQVVLKLKTPWRDGTTHLVMSPAMAIRRCGRVAGYVGRTSRPVTGPEIFVMHVRPVVAGSSRWQLQTRLWKPVVRLLASAAHGRAGRQTGCGRDRVHAAVAVS